jgi:DNA-binding GntR family transcriptional regulator
MNMQSDRSGRAGLPAHELVYRRLRDMILFGELAPGQPVTIQGLVDRLEVGMTPIREALRRLTAEGALQALGNRRIAVPELTVSDVDELTQARVALEPLLAERACRRATDGMVAELAEIDAALDEAIGYGDIGRYLQHNHAFHRQLNTMAEAPILQALVDGLWLRFGPSLRVVCGQVGTQNVPDRHKDLMAALTTGDPQAAARAIREDVEQGMVLVRRAAL